MVKKHFKRMTRTWRQKKEKWMRDRHKDGQREKRVHTLSDYVHFMSIQLGLLLTTKKKNTSKITSVILKNIYTSFHYSLIIAQSYDLLQK